MRSSCATWLTKRVFSSVARSAGEALGDQAQALAPQPHQLLHAERAGRAERGDQRRDERRPLVQGHEQRHAEARRRRSRPAAAPAPAAPACRAGPRRWRTARRRRPRTAAGPTATSPAAARAPAPAAPPTGGRSRRRRCARAASGWSSRASARWRRRTRADRGRARRGPDRRAVVSAARARRSKRIVVRPSSVRGYQSSARPCSSTGKARSPRRSVPPPGGGVQSSARHRRGVGLPRHRGQADRRQHGVAGAVEQRDAADDAVVVGLHGDHGDAAGAAQLGPRRGDVGPGHRRRVGGDAPAEAVHRRRVGGVGGERERHRRRGDDRAGRAIEGRAQLRVAGARLGEEHVEDDAARAVHAQVVDDVRPHVAAVGPRAGQRRQLGERAIVDVEDDRSAGGVGQRRRDQAGGEIAEPAIELARDRRGADGRGDGEAREDRARDDRATSGPPSAAPPGRRRAPRSARASHHHERVADRRDVEGLHRAERPSVPSALTMAMRTP